MKINHFATGSAIAALALLGACGGTNNTTATTDTTVVDNGMTADPMAADNAAVGMASNQGAMADTASMAPMTAQQFVDAAAASDAYEIAAGKLAETKATDPMLKDFGKEMQTDHAKSTADLKAAAAKAEPAVTPGAEMTAEQQSNLDALRNASGTAFDEAYRAQQVVAHEKALAMLQGYAGNGDAAPLKEFAAKTAPVVQRHLEMIRK